MFARLLYESFRRQKRRKLLAGIAITLGVAVATAMIAVATDIGDKINRELRSYGANLLVTPQEDTIDVEIGGVNLKPPSDGDFLSEADLPKIKGTFWRHNILGFSPMLPVNVSIASSGRTHDVTLLGTYFAKRSRFRQGTSSPLVLRSTHPWWKVDGAWPMDESSDVLLGEHLAREAGLHSRRHSSTLPGRIIALPEFSPPAVAEDEQIVAPLQVAQKLLGKPEAVRRVYVSALTKPEDALARRDPKTMSARTLRSLVLFALRAVDCLPVAGSDPAFSCGADPAGGAERRHGAVAHQGPDAADHAGGAFRIRPGGLGRHGHGNFRAPPAK